MPAGGRQRGSGRKLIAGKFRSTCREIVESPEVQQLFRETAMKDPYFALKLAEHGWGRPPQSLDIRTEQRDNQREYRAVFADGAPVSAAAIPVPDGPPN